MAIFPNEIEREREKFNGERERERKGEREGEKMRNFMNRETERVIETRQNTFS